MTLDAVGEAMGVSRQRAHQVETRALAKMAARMVDAAAIREHLAELAARWSDPDDLPDAALARARLRGRGRTQAFGG